MPSNDVIERIIKTIAMGDDGFKIGVLVSGEGSNLQALIDYAAHPDAHFKVACVISNNPDGIALKRAQRAGIINHFVNHQAFSNRSDFEQELIEFLEEERVHLVVLAGFLRVLTSSFLSHFRHRVINLHPSLLPDFKGLHAVEQAMCAGVDRVGCTVHLVDEGLDSGDIIEQYSCAIERQEKIESVKEKIHKLEHKLLPSVVNHIALKTLEKSSFKELNMAPKNCAANY